MGGGLQARASGDTATEGAKLPPAVIAVIDVQKIMNESSAAKSVKEQLAARRQSYQKEVTADEQALREEEKKLMGERKTLSEEEFAKKRQAFETKVGEAQRKIQKKTQELDAAFNQALGTIKKSLGQIVAQKAADRGATLVLDRGQTVVVESSFDITTSVLEELNKQLPQVKVALDAKKPAEEKKK